MKLKKEANPMTGGVCCTFKKGENFFYADRSWVSYLGCFETMIFPANEEGEVTDWGELYCDRSGKSLDKCVEEFLSEWARLGVVSNLLGNRIKMLDFQTSSNRNWLVYFLKSYKEMDYKEECQKCKDILRPMAAAIYGHLYQVDNSHYRDEIDQVRYRAQQAVLAASCICEVLDNLCKEDWELGVEERKLQLGNRIYQRLSLTQRVNKMEWL